MGELKTRIRQFKAANRPASKRNIILVACNLILVTGAVCAAIIYSQIIMEQKNALRKDAFCTTVESMKQVSENYLYTEKGYVDEWAAYISSQHMTAEQALEIIDLENRILDEFKGSEELVEGTVTIGCGEFTADTVLDMMNKGLIDIGLFLEPVSTEGLEYIRLEESDHWVVSMKPDDPLAQKKFITKEDFVNLPLILPERAGADRKSQTRIQESNSMTRS